MRRDQECEKKRSMVAEFTSRGEENHKAADLKKAIENYKAAYKIARELNDDLIERICALNLGAAYIGADDPKEGLHYLHKAKPLDGERDEPSNGAWFFNNGLGHEKMGDTKNALDNFLKAAEEYKHYERNSDVLIHCLEKCLRIYENQKQYVNAAKICKDIADEHVGLSKASKLCERIAYLRLGKCKEDSLKEALALFQTINEMELEGEECLQAGKVLNDLGLAFTLVNDYPNATCCFEKALERIQCSHITQDQLEAVVLQNLGAAYNFTADYQRAVKFHEDAVEKYGKTNNRNCQGQCFTNLAFALTQIGKFREAEVAFHHALRAAKDSNDQHMEWQALEGLGAVNFSQGNLKPAVDFYLKALQTVGNQQPACERIKNKIYLATQQLHAERGKASPNVSNTLPLQTLQRTGPLFEEHAQVVPTPRSSTIMTMTEEEVQVPSMVKLEEEPPKRNRFVRVRKRDSIGPHAPKISRGLSSSCGYYESPRTTLHSSHQPMLEELSESEESETTSSSSDDSSSESEEESTVDEGNLIQSQKVDEIFNRPNQTIRETMTDEDKQLHSEYQAHLQSKERDEDDDDDDDDSSEETSSSDSSDDDDDDDDDDDVKPAPVSQPKNASPPPLPTQSPPNTALVSQGEFNTYLEPHVVKTPADVHESVSSSRVARQHEQPGTSGGSPRESPAHSENDENDGGQENDDDETTPKVLYSTVDKTQQLRAKQEDKNDPGNVNTVPPRTRLRNSSSDGRKGENFFDTDSESLHSNRPTEDTRADDEDPYHSLNFAPEEGVSGSASHGVREFNDLPRGQKEKILADYHQQHEVGRDGDQNPPPELPARGYSKKQKGEESKTCNIM